LQKPAVKKCDIVHSNKFSVLYCDDVSDDDDHEDDRIETKSKTKFRCSRKVAKKTKWCRGNVSAENTIHAHTAVTTKIMMNSNCRMFTNPYRFHHTARLTEKSCFIQKGENDKRL